MTNGTVLVASPSAIGRQPEASGSSVPAWPARLHWNSRLIAPTAWVEVMPTGLVEHDPAVHVALDAAELLRLDVSRRCLCRLFTMRAGEAYASLPRSLLVPLFHIALYRGCSQKLLDPFRFVESFVNAEANFRSKF